RVSADSASSGCCLLKEFQDRLMSRSWLIRSEDVAGMGDHHQLGPGNLFRDELSVAWSNQAVPPPRESPASPSKSRTTACSLPRQKSPAAAHCSHLDAGTRAGASLCLPRSDSEACQGHR